MPLILPGNVASAAAAGYNVANSCRLDGVNAYMNRSTGVTTTNTKFTLSFWLKMGETTLVQTFFETYTDSSNRFWVRFNLDNAGEPRLEVSEYQSAYTFRKIFTRIFRDMSAHYHFVIRFDSTESTDTDVPSAITTFRAAVRTKAAAMETLITNASNTPAIETLYTYVNTADEGDPVVMERPLGEWPELEV